MFSSMSEMVLSVTPLYLSLLVFVFMGLCANVIRLRIKHRVSVGDNGHKDLMRAIRAHANFAEYVPLAMMAFALAELYGFSEAGLHILGAGFVLGRILHAYGICTKPENFLARRAGVLWTFLTLLVLAVYLLWQVIS